MPLRCSRPSRAKGLAIACACGCRWRPPQLVRGGEILDTAAVNGRRMAEQGGPDASPRCTGEAHRMDDSTLAGFVRATSHLIMVTDVDGRIAWANPAFLRTTGYTLAELRGRHPFELLHGPATDAQAEARIERTRREGRPLRHIELANYRRD